ncbi:MAG: AAA family ATPase [Nitritalea sp.]
MLSIAIVGPESSGKSTLAKELQAQLGGIWLPEYAREYLGDQGPPYARETLWEIAKGQLAAEAAARALQPRYLWCDTSMLTMKIWEEHAFGAVAPFIAQAYAEHPYALYVLPDYDLPWEPDPLRGFPDPVDRAFFHAWHKREILESPIPLLETSGSVEEQVRQVINKVRDLENE